MSYILQILQPRREYFKVGYLRLTEFLKLVANNLLSILHTIKRIGVTDQMNEYEKKQVRDL